MSDEIQPIGQVTHYFNRIGVAVLALYEPVALGQWLHFYGNSTNFAQPIESMEINHAPVEEAYPDEEVAIKVDARVRVGDWVYPYEPE
jgi:hypothetical protein